MALTHAQQWDNRKHHEPYGYDLGLLIGKTLRSVTGGQYTEQLRMEGDDGTVYVLGNAQYRDDGYETGLVSIEDVAGDLDDLVGSPITQAEEVSDLSKRGDWTFYRLSTAKGQVVLRFCDNDFDTYYAKWVDFMVFPQQAATRAT